MTHRLHTRIERLREAATAARPFRFAVVMGDEPAPADPRAFVVRVGRAKPARAMAPSHAPAH